VFLLPGQDVASRLPIEEDELAINRDGCSKLGGPDPLLEFAEERLVALRRKVASRFSGGWVVLRFLLGHWSSLTTGLCATVRVRGVPESTEVPSVVKDPFLNDSMSDRAGAAPLHGSN